MDEKLKEEFSAFAFSLGRALGFASRALREDEVFAEFAARGISRHELEELIESCKQVGEVFYNDPQPV